MKILLAFIVFTVTSFAARAQESKTMLFDKQLVDLKCKAGTTVFINSTADTVKFNYTFFNWLPYTEFRDTLTIPPGRTDSLVLNYNFPDFFEVDNWLHVYNAPGGRVVCDMKSLKSKPYQIAFTGSFKQENDYYTAYYHYLGSFDNEGRPYYQIADQLKDFNRFPAKADSLTQIRLKFLDSYAGALPAWFRPHEHRRLLYKQYQLLLNALLSKEFYSGHPIPVNAAYFDFEKLLNQDGDMVLNDTYLYCMNDYFSHRVAVAKTPGVAARAYMIDSLYRQTAIGDVNLMYLLGKLYRFDKGGYDQVISKLHFKEPGLKEWYNAHVQNMLGTPYIGVKAPAMSLTDVNGKAVSLNDYAGKMLILNFWAVWCGPCKAEFPDENRFYRQYKDKGVAVINICFDSDREAWLHDTKKYNLQMVNLFTAKGDYSKLLKQYNLTAPPCSVLINRAGVVVENYLKRISALTEADIAKIVNTK